MQRKTCILFISVGICLLLGFSQYQTVGMELSASSSPSTSVQGTDRRVGERLYGQALGEVVGLCIEGVNAIPGQMDVTDLLMVGTTGSGSWRSLQGYNASISTGLPVLQSASVNAVVDMLRFEDTNLNNAFVIYAEGESDAGRLVKQYGTPLTYSTRPTIIQNKYITTDYIIGLCTGNFDEDTYPEVITIEKSGDVSAVMDLNIFTGTSLFVNLGYASEPDRRMLKNPIVAIENLDSVGPTWQDLIIGHYNTIYAVSAKNFTNPIIWNTSISGRIGSCVVTPDLDEDTYQDVVVAATTGLYLLSGKTGAILTSRTNIGSYFRDAILFSDYSGDSVPEILTGNWQGDVILWNINPLSEQFGDVILNLTRVGGRITSFLELPDLNDDGKSEFAVGGGNGFLGVLQPNGTWYWKTGVSGSGLWSNAWWIDIYDIALLDDRNGDGWPDIAVTGGYESQESGAFIYSSQGGLNFQPDLHGFGIVDSICGTPNHIFSFTLTVYQEKNLTVTAQVDIDGVQYLMNAISSILDWTKGVNFEYNTTLPLGSHTYRFLLDDSIDSITIPASSTNTLEVAENCPTCTDCTPSLNIVGSVEVISICALATTIILIRKILKSRKS